MKNMEFTLKTIINSSPEKIYSSWLNSKTHSKMTGGIASISDKVGDKFTAWNEYIEGTNLKLEQNKRILQSWRTSDFAENEEDSELDILFKEIGEQTELTLIHKNLPAHGEQYKKGWHHHYFQPMNKYFSQQKNKN